MIGNVFFQLAVMDDQFCVVPFWDIPSPEADNLLSDCFIGYDDNSSSKVTSRYLFQFLKPNDCQFWYSIQLSIVLLFFFIIQNICQSSTFRCPSSDSKLSTGHLLGESLEDALEWTFASTAMRNDEGRFLCTLDSGNDRPIYYDGSEISSLNEFMNLYGITNLDSDDDFNMKSIDMMVATTPQAKEAVVLTPSDEILTNVGFQ